MGRMKVQGRCAMGDSLSGLGELEKHIASLGNERVKTAEINSK